MKHKKTLLVMAGASVLAVGAVGVVAFGPTSTAELFGTECSHAQGYHYAAHAATATEDGNAEFWTCCSCHETFLTAPATGSFADRADLSEAVGFDEMNIAHLAAETGTWDGSIGTGIRDGSGTATDPYVIRTPREFAFFADKINRAAGEEMSYLTANYTLANNLDMAEKTWSCIGINQTNAFKGVFDGGNKLITNIKTVRTNGCTAIFGNAINATIKNLNVSNATFNSTSETAATAQRTGVIVGRAEKVTLNNVNVLSGTVNGSQENGGLLGVVINGATITDCSNAASVGGSAGSVGGLVGNNYSGATVITNSTNTGVVNSASNVAGLVGKVTAGSVTIDGSTNGGAVTGTSGVGGLIGRLVGGTATITGAANSGTVKGTGEGVGGIVGWQWGDSTKSAFTQLYISETTNNGDVNRTGTGVNGCGGFLGLNVDNCYFEITDCVNRGNVTDKGAYTGGFVGLIRKGRVPGASAASACNKLTNCTNYGNVTYGATAGGALAGINRGIITNCKVLETATVNGTAVSALPYNATTGAKRFVFNSDNGGTISGCTLISE